LRELHISEVSNCTVKADCSMISGALHVTKCNNLELWLESAHQLRIHESSELSINIAEASQVAGAILENCSNVVFYVAADSHDLHGDRNFDKAAIKLLDVKDFSWLHRGVASPNFRLVLMPKVSKNISATKVETELKVSDMRNPTAATSTIASTVPTPARADLGEDSDDEL
jgi:Tubulin binding cofactor C